MRVLWLSHRDVFHPLRGGAERTIYEIARHLVKRGHEVVWFSVAPMGPPSPKEIEGIHLVRTEGNLSSHLSVPWTIRQAQPDVVVEDLAHVLPWVPDWLTRCPVTAFFRHLHSRTLPGQVGPIERTLLINVESRYSWVFRRSPFVTESDQSVSDLIRLGIDRKRISRIPPGVDLKLFQPREKTVAPSLVYFSGFKDYKRPHIALEVLYSVLCDFPDAQLTFIGTGPNLNRVKSLVSPSFRQSVKFKGRIPDEEVAATVARSWVHVYPTQAEGWGYCALEAAAAATPTVAFHVPGPSEVVVSGETGKLVPDGDVDAMSRACAELLTNQRDFPDKCRRYAAGFTWAKCANSWERHLLDLQ